MPGGYAVDTVDYAYAIDPLWRDRESLAIKTNLLFFEGVAVLVSNTWQPALAKHDPSLVLPLLDQGLLQTFRAEQYVDKSVSDALGALLHRLLNAGAFDGLSVNRREDTGSPNDPVFKPISSRRVRYPGDATNYIDLVLDDFVDRGLVEDHGSENPRRGARIAATDLLFHPRVADTIQVALPYLIGEKAALSGYRLNPVFPGSREAIEQTLSSPGLPTAGHVIAIDVEDVIPDLSRVPLDEVLEFREVHGIEYRNYMRDVRHFTRDLSLLEPEDRVLAYRDRRDEVVDRGTDLSKLAKQTFGLKLTGLSLGLIGSAASLYEGNPFIAAISAAAAAVSAVQPAPREGTFAYLFRAARRFESR